MLNIEKSKKDAQSEKQAELVQLNGKNSKEKAFKLFTLTIIAVLVILCIALMIYSNSESQFNQNGRMVKHEMPFRSGPDRRGKLYGKVSHKRPPLAIVKNKDKIASQMQEKKEEKPVKKCPELAARKVAFNEEEYAPFAKSGKAIISGTACATLSDGSEKCFENVNVFINPVTSYSNEWYERGWAGREALARADERAFKFNKMKKSGKDGAFKFENLQPGSYYVAFLACTPEGKDKKGCRPSRYAAKVTMKRFVKPTFKRVYP